MQHCRSTWAIVVLLVSPVCGCAGAPSQSPPHSSITPAGKVADSPPAAIRDADPCETASFEAGRLRVSQRWVRAESKCIVMVSADAEEGKSRSFLFNSQGLLLTFGAFGEGPPSRSTGARTHFLLPNVQLLRVERTEARVLVHTTSGHTVTFDPASGRPEGISEGTFQVTPQVTANDGGGVTLRSEAGVIVDFGYTRGGSPHSDPEGRATLRDGDGRECVVANKDLLSYDREEPYLVVSSPEQLSSFLTSERGTAAKCNSLTLDAD